MYWAAAPPPPEHDMPSQNADEVEWNRIMGTFTNHQRVIHGPTIRRAVKMKEWKKLLPLLNPRQQRALGLSAEGR